MTSFDSIIDFLKTFKSPSANFFIAILLVLFAPNEWKVLAVFPAGIFLGWLWDYIYKNLSSYNKKNKAMKSFLSLNADEKRVLDSLRQEKMLTFSQEKGKAKEDYKILKELERKGFVECGVNHGYGGKWYHFSILSNMAGPIREFFKENKEEDVGRANEK